MIHITDNLRPKFECHLVSAKPLISPIVLASPTKGCYNVPTGRMCRVCGCEYPGVSTVDTTLGNTRLLNVQIGRARKLPLASWQRSRPAIRLVEEMKEL